MISSRRIACWLVGVVAIHFGVSATPGLAHPVARKNHDRTITVRLADDVKTGQLCLRVDYRLDVDEFTAIFDDLPALGDKADLSKLQKPNDYYEAFTRLYAPILAANLVATLDDQPLEFTCSKRGHRLTDDDGTPLNHLRCDFVFVAVPTGPTLRAGLPRSWPRADLPAPFALTDFFQHEVHRFAFREGNYELEEGLIRLSLEDDGRGRLLNKIEPDAALKALPASQLKPGDDAKLRKVQAMYVAVSLLGDKSPNPFDRMQDPLAHASRTISTPFSSKDSQALPRKKELQPGTKVVDAIDLPSKQEEPANVTWWELLREGDLRRLFLEQRLGFWALLCLSIAVGGIHALTPGHGKTLVAAYLVGERGTIGHALLLGLTTTLTHTGVVIAVAVALRLSFPEGAIPDSAKQGLHTALSLGGGVLVVCLGFWLLLRRLTGQADHFHLPGQAHHHLHGHSGHSHAHADHYHDEHGHTHPLPNAAQPVGWWGLIVLGISGGIVPCWDAIGILILAVSMNMLWLALPMILAFSAGLASVLILIGIIVVRAKRLAGGGWEQSRLVRSLPIVSALLVTALGFWLCFTSLHSKAAPAKDPQTTGATRSG